MRENYHRFPKIRENRLSRIRNRVPTDPCLVPNIFLKKNTDYMYIVITNLNLERC